MAFGRAITATSANRSGAPAALVPDEVRAAFGGVVHLLDGGAAPGAPASTVARVDDHGAITVLRQGPIRL
jgi:tRNA A37 threonylcarbamoyladenosine synthetase subunit TsaC/SUA5/YrdC